MLRIPGLGRVIAGWCWMAFVNAQLALGCFGFRVWCLRVLRPAWSCMLALTMTNFQHDQTCAACIYTGVRMRVRCTYCTLSCRIMPLPWGTALEVSSPSFFKLLHPRLCVCNSWLQTTNACRPFLGRIFHRRMKGFKAGSNIVLHFVAVVDPPVRIAKSVQTSAASMLGNGKSVCPAPHIQILYVGACWSKSIDAGRLRERNF